MRVRLSVLRNAAAATFLTIAIQPASPPVDALATAERSELRDLYQPADAPAWLDAEGRPTASARDALAILRRAADEGLDPADYEQETLDRLAPRNAAVPGAADPTRFDAALSAGMLRFLRDIHLGRVDPRAAGFQLTEVPYDKHDFAALLRAAIAAQRVPALVAELRPSFSQYQLLREALTRYRALAADATFAAPGFAATVHPGDAYPPTDVLRRELAAFGDLAADATAPPGRYEGALVEGVKRFQRRHGLQADGVIGASTAAALRVPPSSRVRQIELSLERLRWVPDLGDERLITLNIPMFRLWAWDVGAQRVKPALAMDVIVGRALNTQTPVFAEDMREVIFRPYWNVPSSILRHEVLPKIERDPDYMRREGLEIVRGSADEAQRVAFGADSLAMLRQGVLRVRQRPGPKNSLGLIKFVFPNQHDVYMHGTPAQALFARSRRDFSHGCVRVFDPVALAEWVLQDRPEWTHDRIVAATNGAETIHVKLPRPIQVILFYTTAVVVPDDGTIHFAEDIYRRDVSLERALASRQR